jgi:hypothetical protein
MSGGLGAAGPADAGSAGVDPADDPDQALAETRSQLEALATASDEQVRTQRYWLYEHLWRLSVKASAILDAYEDDAGLIMVGEVMQQYLDPLRAVRADLNTYYWRRDSLMARAASTKFDFELLDTIKALRDDWQDLVSAMKVYSAARQSSDMRQLGDLQVITDRQLIRTMAAFVRTLDSLVTTHGFETQAARLAKTMGITPRRRRRRRDPRSRDRSQPLDRPPPESSGPGPLAGH